MEQIGTNLEQWQVKQRKQKKRAQTHTLGLREELDRRYKFRASESKLRMGDETDISV